MKSILQEYGNFTNAKVNSRLKFNDSPYRRKGKCKDCDGKCCNFVVMSAESGDRKRITDYWKLHGAIEVIDKWDKHKYLMIHSRCSNCTSSGTCKVFNKKKMPIQCGPFPSSPFDTVYRYLKQINTPCGFYFVNVKTGKPWNMRRKERSTVKKPKESKEQKQLMQRAKKIMDEYERLKKK